jgi:hypothetical protein
LWKTTWGSPPRSSARWLLLTASLLTGLLLAVITVHLAGSWTAVPGPGR